MILEKIISKKTMEVAEHKRTTPTSTLEKLPYFERKCLSLKNSLLDSETGIIAEFKRKSPSLDWINKNADLLQITAGYSAAGASGISILTDETFFGGTLQDVISARPNVAVPILRKDFVIDEYQIFEAKAAGADIILLIASALTKEKTLHLAQQAKSLGLEILLEIHDETELAHANKYVDLLGVNNRNLKTFEQNIETSFRLATLIPDDFVKVSESGISRPETICELRKIGYKGFLMGENFMKTEKPAETLKKFISSITKQHAA